MKTLMLKSVIVHPQNLHVDLAEVFKTVSLSDTIRFIIINTRDEKEPGVGAGVEKYLFIRLERNKISP